MMILNHYFEKKTSSLTPFPSPPLFSYYIFSAPECAQLLVFYRQKVESNLFHQRMFWYLSEKQYFENDENVHWNTCSGCSHILNFTRNRTAEYMQAVARPTVWLRIWSQYFPEYQHSVGQYIVYFILATDCICTNMWRFTLYTADAAVSFRTCSVPRHLSPIGNAFFHFVGLVLLPVIFLGLVHAKGRTTAEESRDEL